MRATEALDELTRSLEQTSWPAVAHRFSNLTADGYPLELSFGRDDAQVRWVSEVAAAEVGHCHRLDLGLALMARLGAGAMEEQNDPLLSAVRKAQVNQRLRFGAWLGGRHCAATDSYKLYLEIPEPVAGVLADELIGPENRPNVFQGVLRMIGWMPGSQTPELYFRAPNAESWQIESLVARNCGSDRAAELMDLMAEVADHPVHQRLPWHRVGFSVRLGSPEVVVFAVARSLLGSDANIRRQLIKIVEQRGWQMPNYAAVSEPIRGRTKRPTRHGMIAFGASEQGTALGVGLRPPEPAEVLSILN